MASLVIGALPLATKALSLSSTLSSSPSKTPIAVSVSRSTSASSTSPPFIYCGRGDKKTAKGKRVKHSFGNPPRAPVPPLPSRKDCFDDRDEKIEIEIDGPLFS